MRIRSIRNRSDENGPANQAPTAPTTVSPKSALNETEAACYIGMSSGWLKKSRTRRFRDVIDAPPFVRAGAKRVVYRREDLDAWQERHIEQVGPTSGMSPVRLGERGGDTTAESEAVP